MNNKLITAEDHFIMPYGKHKGEKLEDIPDSYIRWAMENGMFTKNDFESSSERGSIARYFKLAYSDMKK